MMPFPWEPAMQFGFGILRLAPADFWAMTPRELAAAHAILAGHTGSAPDRTTLAGLMHSFPDQEKPNE